MKRIFLMITILFISVLSTACVNNLAIQELNNKAQEYMEKGDVDAAIGRLEASLDLDGNVFETNYNLGIAYLNAKKYESAIQTLKKAVELKPDVADTYYSLAVAIDELNTSEINKIKNAGNYVEDGDTPVVTVDTTVVNLDDKKELTPEEKSIIEEKVNETISAYKTYLEKNPNAEEKSNIENRISSLANELNFDTPSQ